MSILDYTGPGILGDMFEPCVMMDRQTVNASDGQFGMKERYVEGAGFDALIEKVSSPEVKVAEQDRIREQYTLVVRRGFPLKFGDVIKRAKNGETLRVTSRPNDKEAPDVSTVQIAAVSAERWEIPA